MQKQQLITIEQKVKPLLAKATDFQVTDDTTLTTATELLSQANITLKEVKAQHEAEAEPYETPLTLIDQRYKPTEKALTLIIASIRSQVGAYQTKVTQLRQAEELAIASRIKAGTGNLSLDSAVAQIENLDKPIEKVVVSSGSLTFRPKPTLKITDPTKIPREYLTPDEDKIFEALQSGIAIPGAEIEIVQIPVNRR